VVAVEVPKHHECKDQRNERVRNRGVCHYLVDSDSPSGGSAKERSEAGRGTPDEIQNPDGGGSQGRRHYFKRGGSLVSNHQTGEQAEKYRRDSCDLERRAASDQIHAGSSEDER